MKNFKIGVIFASLIVVVSSLYARQYNQNITKPIPNEKYNYSATAYVAGGCFWGVEYYMEKVDGIGEAQSGYMGGNLVNPSYHDVSYDNTGHLEVVEVKYDPKIISYEKVIKRFFEIHDPTQANGQGPDIGEQYKSAIFYSTPTEKKTVEKLSSLLKKRGYDVKTVVRKAEPFYIAEEYHQDYYTRHKKEPYCHSYVKRFAD